MKNFWIAVGLLALLAGCQKHHAITRAPEGPPLLKPGTYDIAAITAPELDSLPRDHSLVFLPVGMTEEHGPHLPNGADTFQLDHEMAGLTRALGAALPDWYLLVLPTLPYGTGGANGIGGDPFHTGTYELEPDTLRQVVKDLGTHVAQSGFRWTFVVYTHGAPQHAKAISKACDSVSDEFGVTMVNLTTTTWADPGRIAKVKALLQKSFSQEQVKAMGSDIHAGAVETSMMLAAAPDRVRPVYHQLPAQAADGYLAMRKLAQDPSWPGYFGAPAFATQAFGQAKTRINLDVELSLVLAAVRGDTLRDRPRDY